MALGLAVMTVPSASAQSDGWTHPDGVGYMYFNDDGDIYRVCDTKSDSVGVSGRIEVKKADGTWNKTFPWLRDGDGNNGTSGDACTYNNTDVQRESATYRFTICQQNTASGSRYNCKSSSGIPG